MPKITQSKKQQYEEELNGQAPESKGTEQDLWDSLSYSYGKKQEESDKAYDKAIAQQNNEMLSRGMGRSSYALQSSANLRNEQVKASNDIYNALIADYQNRMSEERDKQWQRDYQERQLEETRRQFDEQLAHQTSEREASQAYQTSEREAQQQYQTGERESQQDWQSKESQYEREFKGTESAKDREQQTSERRETQDWQSTESEQDRDLQREQAELDREQKQQQIDLQKEQQKQSARQELYAMLDKGTKWQDIPSELYEKSGVKHSEAKDYAKKLKEKEEKKQKKK